MSLRVPPNRICRHTFYVLGVLLKLTRPVAPALIILANCPCSCFRHVLLCDPGGCQHPDRGAEAHADTDLPGDTWPLQLIPPVYAVCGQGTQTMPYRLEPKPCHVICLLLSTVYRGPKPCHVIFFDCQLYTRDPDHAM